MKAGALGAVSPPFTRKLAASRVIPLRASSLHWQVPAPWPGRIEAPLWRPQDKKETTMTTPSHTCYTVRDRGEGRKAYWAIIGSAFTNKDGSLNLVLDSLPLDGKITVRVREEKPAADEAAQA